MSEGIFSSTGQALATSFLIVSCEPKQGSELRRALIQMLESVDLPTARHKEWLDQLRGTHSGNIRFDGLTPEEIRGQCAMIVQAVSDQLPPPESAAVIGAYTRHPIEKARAVRFVSTYVKPASAGESSNMRLLFDYCVLRSMSKHGNQNLKSQRELLNLGVSDRSAASYLREIRKRVNALRRLGEDRMQAIFVRDGVVGDA